jgi:hypothetical protein
MNKGTKPGKRRRKPSTAKDLPVTNDKDVKGGALNVGTRLGPAPPPITPLLGPDPPPITPAFQPAPPPIMPTAMPAPPPI